MKENEKGYHFSDDEEGEEMTVTLNLDDGDVDCAVIVILTVGEQDYIVLMPLDEDNEPTGNVWFYRYYENENDPNEEPVIEYISDTAEYEDVSIAYDEYLDSTEHDEIIESSDDE